ncbi:MAG: Spy/CpxP family protein refolding chaperone [Muribaculaceae bacterium]|nr:Spy/CpxP family protein refolding chaperone [Muribaculaceae bacterium]
MKKVILSLAIFAATSLSMMAANDNNATNNEKARTECCKDKGECKKGDRPGKKDGKFDRADRGMKAFEGLNLTDAQKTKLEELQKQCKETREKEMKAFKETRDKEKKDFKDRKDLTDAEKQQMKAEKQKLKAEMQAQRQQQKQNYLNGVKSILTPEQYTKFLENNFMMAGNNHQKGMKGGKQMRSHKGSKQMKGGMHANKGKKSMRSQKDMQKSQNA